MDSGAEGECRYIFKSAIKNTGTLRWNTETKTEKRRRIQFTEFKIGCSGRPLSGKLEPSVIDALVLKLYVTQNNNAIG